MLEQWLTKIEEWTCFLNGGGVYTKPHIFSTCAAVVAAVVPAAAVEVRDDGLVG